jgi:hypothetical protein
MAIRRWLRIRQARDVSAINFPAQPPANWFIRMSGNIASTYEYALAGETAQQNWPQ